MSIRIAGQVIASAGSLTAHNEDPNAHADIRELISQGGGSSEAKWGAITGDINAQTDLTAAIAEKQDKLTAGEGITIDGNVISATGGGGSAELPDNVYTEDNLIAGENVTITDVLPEGGIDEFTLSCFHLDETDNNAVDEVTGISLPVTSDTTLHKFGTGCAMFALDREFPWSVNMYESFSFDYWLYRKSDRSFALGFKRPGQANSFTIVIYSGNYPINLQVNGTNYDTGVYAENNTWSHIYAYYNSADQSFHLFLNGKEIYSVVSTHAFSGLNCFTTDGYTTSRVDEVRISKCIRWAEEFTPPTEPYTLATGPSKKAINAVIPEVELPDTVYTQDNLVAGDNIKIKEVVNPNVIDDNTLLCWHFDGDTKDVVQGAEIELYPGYASLNTSVYKFGSGSCPDYLNPGKYINLGTTITDNDNFTIDFWTRALNNPETFSWKCSLMGTTSVNFSAFGSNNLLFQAIDPNYGTEAASIQKTNTIDATNWSHWAFTYNKDTREVAVYANGEKQGSTILPTSFTFSFDTFNPLDTNYNQGLIDELRVTKSLAWDKDFTPPTEAYTKGEGGVKKSINAIIPEGIYTQSNLLGGKDIEIIPEPVDGGVDEYTTGMWHFDSSMFDEINNKGFSYDRVGTYIDGKFGKGVYSVYGGRTDSEILCETQSIEKDFTIDCVVLPKDTSSSGTILYLYAGDQSGDYYGLSVTYSMIGGSVSLGHRSAVLTSKTLTPLTAADKPHLALQRRGTLVEVFIEGKKEIEYDISSINTELTGKGFGVNSATWVGIDELRISNIARYTEDFTPPMLPYSKAEPTGNYVINFTGYASSSSGSSKNIGEVYYSQSSLASDNAGALPLFTGETISSANTIYPDFYAWVESHTELQATAEEYESALSAFGECAKYVVSNGSLRLPKLSNYVKMANTTDGITQGEAGLPNITGQTNFAPNAGMRNDAQPRGAFYKATATGHIMQFEQAAGNDLGFDASLSSEVYGKSDTVTPAHTTLYPWVFAYNASVPASAAQTAEFQQGLSGKADADLNNAFPSKTFRENVFNWCLPDYTSGVTKTWDTEYTAETNGWVYFNAFLIDEGTALRMLLNGAEVSTWYYAFDGQGTVTQTMPVSKGDVYKVTGAHSQKYVIFYPCKGEVL